MTEAYNRFLGVTRDPYGVSSHRRRIEALQDRAAQALRAENWAAAQAYALLLIAERQEDSRVSINWAGWEDFAIALAAHIAPDLRQIRDAIDGLDR
jgi:hypothetical protein